MLAVRPLHHLHHSLVIRLATLELPFGDNDIVDEVGVLRYEECHILLHTQLSNDLVVGTLHDLYHHSLLDMLVTTGHVRHLYLVAIHCRH